MPNVFKTLLLLILFSAAPAYGKPQIVFNVNSGEILSANDIDQQWYPASLTKIMTGYLAFIAITEHSDISLNTQLIISQNAAKQPPSKLGIKAGSSIKMERALQALFTRSNNDIAVAIAEKISGNEAEFIKLMNHTAKNLGMSRTQFTNPHGLYSKRQVSSARDLAKLSRAILLEFPQFSRFYSLPYFTVNQKNLPNRNQLLKNYQGADGLKTGFVCASGYNLIATASRNGQQIAAILLGGKSVKTRDAAVVKLLDKGFISLKNPNKTTIYTAKNQNYKPPVNMRPIACAPH